MKRSRFTDTITLIEEDDGSKKLEVQYPPGNYLAVPLEEIEAFASWLLTHADSPR